MPAATDFMPSVTIDGEELLIMKESDILGVIEGSKAAKAA
jgi:chaperonin GroES